MKYYIKAQINIIAHIAYSIGNIFMIADCIGLLISYLVQYLNYIELKVVSLILFLFWVIVSKIQSQRHAVYVCVSLYTNINISTIHWSPNCCRDIHQYAGHEVLTNAHWLRQDALGLFCKGLHQIYHQGHQIGQGQPCHLIGRWLY